MIDQLVIGCLETRQGGSTRTIPAKVPDDFVSDVKGTRPAQPDYRQG